MEQRKVGAALKALHKELQSESRILKSEIAYLKKHLDKLWEHVSVTNERLQDLEIQMNILSRLITTLAVEKMDMRTFGLAKMIRKIEKQLVTDSQIRHLEDLYRMDHPGDKKKKDIS
ncbi:MAG: hypothetical protein HY582_00560 [Candidatus Omnitrophica bacterium]|nr:hypothetical protein [Candidatus Omnitrophota bacterium]